MNKIALTTSLFIAIIFTWVKCTSLEKKQQKQTNKIIKNIRDFSKPQSEVKQVILNNKKKILQKKSILKN
ncbi:MAG: hypothetical protein N4A33_07730 [Bacteriovoracaceae bacterium]|jgi:hypothetical protein|nr:hypothetical protein [Bacteriovoracaceae bacterium]